jgi:protein TonB
VATKRDTDADKKEIEMEPIASVKSRAIYDPDPDGKLLQATKAAKFDKRPGSVKVGFCVGATGKTKDVKVTKKYPHDPQVNRICADTVAKWRFKPRLVGGKPVETCSAMTFDIRFE